MTLNLTTDFELPIVVLEGQVFEIAFQSTADLTLELKRNKFTVPEGTDLYLTPGNTTWLDFASFSPEGDSRHENWQIQWWQGNIQDVNKAFGMRVKHASKKDK